MNMPNGHPAPQSQVSSIDLPGGIRILKWLILTWIYLVVLAVSRWVSIPLFFVLLMIFLAAIIFSVYAYTEDQEREKRPIDKLRGHNLFFRYGEEVERTSIALPVKQEWTIEDIASYISRFESALSANIEQRLYPDKPQTVDDHTVWYEATLEPFLRVAGPERQNAKSFIKLTLRMHRGHQVSHFIHVSLAGASAIAHFYVLARGRYAWHDVFDFILMAPLTFVFWTLRWLLNDFSVVTYLGRGPIENSFDGIDADALFTASSKIISEGIARFLKEEGFTDEAAGVVVNKFENSQNINISNRGRLRVGDIVNKVSQAAARHVPGLGN